ncbi:MAG: endonuclease/exonuclease/phosphatase family protein [Waddliaceae bacterium]
MRLIAYILSLFTLISTLLPFIPSDKAWIRNWEFPRVQLFILNALLIGFFIWIYPFNSLFQSIIFFLLIAVALHQGYKIFPYTPLYPKEVLNCEDSEHSVSLFVFNVRMSNREVKAALEMIHNENPDIVLLLETNQWWVDQLSSLNEAYPHQVIYPLENSYGICLYSKLKLSDPKVNFLTTPDIPSIYTWVEIGTGQHIQLYCVHPKPPLPSMFKHGKDDITDIETELVRVANDLKEKRPAIVMGDFNDVAWSPTTALFKKMSGLLDPRVGRGLYNTFHADYFFLRFPVDHIFCSKHFKVTLLKRLKALGSDHFAVFASLKLSK